MLILIDFSLLLVPLLLLFKFVLNTIAHKLYPLLFLRHVSLGLIVIGTIKLIQILLALIKLKLLQILLHFYFTVEVLQVEALRLHELQFLQLSCPHLLFEKHLLICHYHCIPNGHALLFLFYWTLRGLMLD